MRFTSLTFSGWLYDATGNYDVGFYFAGVMIFLSGVMLFAIPWLERKRDEERGETDVEDVERYIDQAGRIVEVDEDDDDPDDEPMTMKT